MENKQQGYWKSLSEKVMGRHFPDDLLLVGEILFVEDEMVCRLGGPATHLNHYCSKIGLK
jgi:hypothetical protein